MGKITWADKVTLDAQPDIARINKVIDEDMNEIKSAVNDNDNNITNITGTILWTNSNPTAITTLTINLSSSDYDVLEIFYKHFANDDYILSQRTLKGAGTIILTQTGDGTILRRTIIQTDDTTLSVGSTTGNDALIPIYVIGYKTGLFNV